ncbi:hypothetical protein [Pseudobacteroides cellulosolvens]|uniref:Uncharacterized protein n=1 Tax=Pseudobacteroides cellulosolvens ATCC 35603 = DSM 2933 TaxID=398512 RepID=A0A0L6JK05_9FIRM|nr:hypothetical protein [Pseudobacteroides cellulosolvens]KNY26048.1 hypothetical protein Bccel_1310 [Pseudobacteroides cellulosolvens ATCC 35603 = DSM 2933]
MFSSYDPTEVTEALIGGGIGLVAIVGVIIFFVLRYRIKIEQIKADAMVRSEEVRAKNQLEIERMLIEERQNQSNYNINKNLFSDDSLSDDEMMQNRRNQKNRM